MPFKDREEKLKYRREWYRRNSERLREKVYTRTRILKLWFKEYKTTLLCIRCGESHTACLEFHHPNGGGTEKVSPGLFASHGYSKERILEKLNKCVVLCANCHRKEHFPASMV